MLEIIQKKSVWIVGWKQDSKYINSYFFILYRWETNPDYSIKPFSF